MCAGAMFSFFELTTEIILYSSVTTYYLGFFYENVVNMTFLAIFFRHSMDKNFGDVEFYF